MEYNSLSALKSKNPFDSAYFMSKRKVSVEDKTYAVNLYLDGKESQRRIADMFDVSLASVVNGRIRVPFYSLQVMP